MNLKELYAFSAKCRKDILCMIQNAGSGHLGGSLSTVDLLIALYDSFPEDVIVVSHGHTSAALYSVLGNFGFFNIAEAVSGFRKAESIYEGHPGNRVPGVRWCSGALGQGLSVGCGFAAGQRLLGSDRHVWVLAGDGEQAKGQFHEARAFCMKYHLSNLTLLIDMNSQQASGSTDKILETCSGALYKAMKWDVKEVDGHDIPSLKQELVRCRKAENPTLLLAYTVMGKGIPEIENDYHFHGQLLSEEVYRKALESFSAEAEGAPLFPMRETVRQQSLPPVSVLPDFHEYTEPMDCRSAFGDTLYEIAKSNPGRTAAVDCDLAASVKLEKYGNSFPERFFECGIAEAHAGSFAAALSRLEPDTFFADFGVFGMTEILSQLRMADFNNTSLKLICTHCGSDVGEDGKTHHAVDYLALMRMLPSFRLLIPADVNQCEHMVRYIAVQTGNYCIAMGRSKQPVIRDKKGRLFFGSEYHLQYGKADLLRMSPDDCGAIVTYGNFVPMAVVLADKLNKERKLSLRVINCHTPLEPDETAFRLAAATGKIAVWEDHRTMGGLGKALGSWYFEHGIGCRFQIFGLTKNGISASPAEQLRYQKITPSEIEQFFITQERKLPC